MCHNLVRLAPRVLPHQTCSELRLLIQPEPFDISHRTDYFGNEVSCFSIDQAHRGMTVTATSQVHVLASPTIDAKDTPAWEDVVNQLRVNRSTECLDALQFVAASQNIKPFAAASDYAQRSFPAGRPILEGVIDLTARIYDGFRFDPRATTIHTPICEVFENRHGVCQDFAHLQIGCLRSIGLAARYISGYLRTSPPPGKPRLVGTDASHAWLSVYCGAARWVDVDPTNNVLVSTDHITVARGRDYSDVCPIQGVIIGGGEHRMSVSVDVAPEDAAATQS